MSAAVDRVRAQGLCEWCFAPLGDQVRWFNGGRGHPACVRWAYETVCGPDPMPWPPRRPYSRRDPMVAFVGRLGREFAKLGVAKQAFVGAVERARRG